MRPQAISRAQAAQTDVPPATVAAKTGEVVIVSVEGVLDRRAYRELCSAVDAAVQSKPRAVVLHVSSPGGEIAGLLGACESLRKALRGTPSIAFVDDQALSAAYLIASSCDRIACLPSAQLGSVGVVGVLEDHSAAFRMAGVQVALVSSGARKADGDPRVPMTAAALASAQREVDALGTLIQTRAAILRGMKPSAVQALDGATFIGSQAKSVGLCDAIVSSLEQTVALASKPSALIKKSAPAKPVAVKKFSPGKSSGAEGRNVDRAVKAALRLQAMEQQVREIEKRAAAFLRKDERASLSIDPEAAEDLAIRMGLRGNRAPRGECTAYRLRFGDMTGIRMEPSKNEALNRIMLGSKGESFRVTATDRKLVLGEGGK